MSTVQPISDRVAVGTRVRDRVTGELGVIEFVPTCGSASIVVRFDDPDERGQHVAAVLWHELERVAVHEEFLRLADLVESEPVALAAGDRVRTVTGERLPDAPRLTGLVLGVVPTGPFPSHARVIVAVDGGDDVRAFDRHELERLAAPAQAASADGWRAELVASTPGVWNRADAARAIAHVADVEEARAVVLRHVPSFPAPEVPAPGWASVVTEWSWTVGDAIWSRHVRRVFEVEGFGAVHVERFEDASAPGVIERQGVEVDVVIDAPASVPGDVAALAAAMGQAHALLGELLAVEGVEAGAL